MITAKKNNVIKMTELNPTIFGADNPYSFRGVLLIALLRSGRIRKRELCMFCKLLAFYSRFSNSSADASMSRHSDTIQLSKLNTKNTSAVSPSNESNGAGSSGASDVYFEESASYKETRYGVEMVQGDRFFKPIYAIGEWFHPDYRPNKMIYAAILSFTGTNRKRYISLNIVDKGNYL